ncbi:MAG TPA: MBOAT family O-acyltransferase [Candidatus Binataceae bacterium]|nr:MBOAT family O-acyltransferase [Candidatus Binataceae bacterium]
MLFNSYQFAFGFLPIVLAIFGLLAARDARRAAAGFLILASIAFYGWWNWHYLFLFGFSIFFNFGWSLLLVPAPATDPAVADAPVVTPARATRAAYGERARRVLLGCGIGVNLALLGYFKYRNFMVASAGALLGTHWHMPALMLPLAISFFSFEQITFLSSAYRGEPGARDFVSYCLFIAFFPHLIAGPIVRYAEIYPQLNRNTRFRLSAANLSDGLMIFAIGLFKKVMLADTFRPIVNPLFDRTMPLGFCDAWGGALAFALEIYFDFSGYSDMAIGLARMFGVKFPENFDSPYQARSIIQFWRRWHITLSFFLRDYLYIPLGGNRHGPLRRDLNLFITMVLGGLWHGASWTFVIWGTLHGVFLWINHVWNDRHHRMPEALAWPLTFVLATAAWVFFRAPSFSRAAQFFTGMAGLGGFAYNSVQYSIGSHEWLLLGLGLAIVLFAPNRQAIVAWRWSNDWLWAGAFAVLAGVSIMGMANPPPFIYFQF